MFSLGRLEKIELRKVWGSEAADFTPWLATEENLALLGESIGLELSLESQEKEVGRFSADILCKDVVSNSFVLIENQLERTDHGHLGQLLTYAAGLDAVSIVWIAEHFTEEHRAALDWLNERTDENINFFGLEIELWKIGNSLIAPKFNVVSKPNDWTRSVQRAAEGDLTETRKLQLRFWESFHEYMAENSKIRCHKPAPQHWMVHSIGRTNFNMSSVASTWDSEKSEQGKELRAELVISDKKSKEYFAILEARRSEIEKAFGEKLVWHNPEDKNMSKIYVRFVTDFSDEKNWAMQHAWLREKLEKFRAVFGPIIREL